jgi:hypothetical protein
VLSHAADLFKVSQREQSRSVGDILASLGLTHACRIPRFARLDPGCTIPRFARSLGDLT